MLIGDAADELGEIGKIHIGEVEVAEWITGTRIEPCGDEDELRAELFHRRQELFLKGGEDFRAARACRQRAIQRGPLPRADAGLAGMACARVPRRLVRAEEKDGAILVKDILRAIAV